MEKIVSIKEVERVEIPYVLKNCVYGSEYTKYVDDGIPKDEKIRTSGYEIMTDKQTIKLLINDEQSCCEDWGYFISEDDISRFIGTDLISISVTDTELKTYSVFQEGEANKDPHYSDNNEKFPSSYMFVNILTSEGLLQFVAYNDHNGYYGHSAYIISEQLKYKAIL